MQLLQRQGCRRVCRPWAVWQDLLRLLLAHGRRVSPYVAVPGSTCRSVAAAAVLEHPSGAHGSTWQSTACNSSSAASRKVSHLVLHSQVPGLPGRRQRCPVPLSARQPCDPGQLSQPSASDSSPCQPHARVHRTARRRQRVLGQPLHLLRWQGGRRVRRPQRHLLWLRLLRLLAVGRRVSCHVLAACADCRATCRW